METKNNNSPILIFIFFIILLIYFLVFNYFFHNDKKIVNLESGNYYSLTELPSFKNQTIMLNFYDETLNKINTQFYGRSESKIKIIQNLIYLEEKIITNNYIPNMKLYKIPYEFITLKLIYNLNTSQIINLKINENKIQEKNIENFKLDLIEVKKNYIYLSFYLQGYILLKDNIYIRKILLKLLFIKKD